MSKKSDEAKTLEVLEASREIKKNEGFIAQLFLGRAKFNLMQPFPEQSPNDKEATNAWLGWLSDFLKNRVNPNLIDESGEIPERIIKELKQTTAFGIKIPKEYGGLGFSQSNYRRVALKLGSWCSNMSALVSAHNSLGAILPLMKYGTDEQKKSFLPKIAAGAIAAFGLTEDDVGSDPSRIKTFALRIREDNTTIGYRLNGKKLYTTNAVKRDGLSLAEIVVIIARIVDDPKEVDDPDAKPCFGLFLITSDQKGYVIGKRCHFEGIRSIYNGEVFLNNIEAPVERRIGDEGDGFRMAMEILTIGRLTVPSLCAGTLKQVLRIARWWGKERVQGGKPIGQHEQNSERLVRIACQTLTLDAMTQFCNLLIDQKKDARIESAAVKIIGTEYLSEALKNLFILRGGRGFETYYSQKARGEVPVPVERMMRDCPINEIFEGPNPVMRLWIGREGADQHKYYGEMTQKKTGETIKGPWGDKKVTKLKKLYAYCWLGKEFIKSFLPVRLNFGPYRRHLHFIRKESKRLTRHMVMISGYHEFVKGISMVKKQVLINNFVNRALGLFEMVVAISYAMAHPDKPMIKELTDYWCWEIRDRLEFRRPRGLLSWALFGHHKNLYRLAKDLMTGKAEWLEEGIVPIDLKKKTLDERVREEEKINTPT